MSSGRDLGILPAKTNMSSLFKLSRMLYKEFSASSLICGPPPLISLSSLDLIFTFILDNPSFNLIKSDLQPNSVTLLSISSPVKPAIKPKAELSYPKFFNTIDTFMPFPPGYTSSSSVLLTLPNFKSLTLTT